MLKKLQTGWAIHERIVTLAILGVALVFPLVIKNPYIVNIGVLVGIYVILSMSLNLITGYMGIVTLGHAAFFGIGAYTSALLSLNFGLNFLVTSLAAAAVSAAFGLLLGLPTLRLSGKYLSIVTLSFCEIVRILEVNLKGLTRGPLGLPRIPAPEFFGLVLDEPWQQYYLVVLLCVLTFVCISRIMNSRVGRGITAIKNDPLAAEAMGVKCFQYKLMTFAVSAMFAGVGGAFYAHYMNYINPANFSFDQSTLILSMTIMGGLGNLFGSIFGAITLLAIPEILRPLMQWRQVIYGVLLVVMVMWRPKGLLGGINLKHIRELTLFQRKAKTAPKKEG